MKEEPNETTDWELSITTPGKESMRWGWDFAAGRMLTPQEQEVKFGLTQSHNQTWQKDWGWGSIRGQKKAAAVSSPTWV